MHPLSVLRVAARCILLERVGTTQYYVAQFPPRLDGKVVCYLIQHDGNDTVLRRYFVGVNEKASMRAVGLYIAELRKEEG